MDEKHSIPARLVLDYEPIRPKKPWWQSRYLPMGLALLVVASCFAYVVAPRHSDRLVHSRIPDAKANISSLETALDAFEIDYDYYPTTAEGLEILVSPPQTAGWHEFIRAVPLDPWGNRYIYVCPGVHNKATFDLSSTGPDGKPGTADDIVNWP
jgi:general secretion pathway protein G